ncbi:MAG: hypothetical protein ABR564_00020 [Candidatus Dormibacteria bacterium]
MPGGRAAVRGGGLALNRRFQRAIPLLMGVAAMGLTVGVFPNVLQRSAVGPGAQASIQPNFRADTSRQAEVPPLNLGDKGVGEAGTKAGSGQTAQAPPGGPAANGGAAGGTGNGAGPAAADRKPGSPDEAGGRVPSPGPTPAPQSPSPRPGQSPGSNPPPSATPGPPPLCTGATQVPDPLSPDCSRYDLGNHGETGQGYDANSITVVVLDCCNDNYVGSGKFKNLNDPPDPVNDQTSNAASASIVRTWKLLRKYFQTHFDLHGRTVQLLDYYQSSCKTNGDVIAKHPFAVVGGLVDHFSDYTCNPNSEYARNGILYFDFQEYDWPRMHYADATVTGKDLTKNGTPMYWSFLPSLDSIMADGASWACRELINKPVTHAGNQNVNGLNRQTRRIALGYDDAPNVEWHGSGPPYNAEGKATLGADLAASFESAAQSNPDCARMHASGNLRYPIFPEKLQVDCVESNNANCTGQQMSLTALATMKDTTMKAKVDTSVLCLFCSVSTGDDFGQAEVASNYYPEQMFISGSAETPYGAFGGARTKNQTTWDQAFGLSEFWKLPATTYWAKAYKEEDQTTEVSQRIGFKAYEELMQVFSAIQLAGTNPTPANVAQGLYGWRRSASTTSPAAGYSAGDPAFIRGMMVELWDSKGVPPTLYPNPIYPNGPSGGCYLMPDNTHRYSRGTWPQSDETSSVGGWSCTSDNDGGAS